MECKAVQIKDSLMYRSRLIGNIVECKVRIKLCEGKSNAGLIGNIVECKASRDNQRLFITPRLIGNIVECKDSCILPVNFSLID